MTIWWMLGFACWTIACGCVGIAIGGIMVRFGVQTEREHWQAIVTQQHAVLEHAQERLGELVEDQQAAIDMLHKVGTAGATGIQH